MAKNCEANETAAKLKAKQYIKAANVDVARVHAETAIRNRHLARHYHTLVANLMPFEFELKKQFSSNNGSNGCASPQTQAILHELNRMKNVENDDAAISASIEISPHHISAIMNELSEEAQLDMLNRLPSLSNLY